MVKTYYIEIRAEGGGEFHNLTEDVRKYVKESGMRAGLVTVYIPSATGAITTIEAKEGLLKDFSAFWEKLIPRSGNYIHDQRGLDSNTFSHLRSSLLGCSITIPFNDSKITLGTWQQIVLVDFDIKTRARKVICQVMGD